MTLKLYSITFSVSRLCTLKFQVSTRVCAYVGMAACVSTAAEESAGDGSSFLQNVIPTEVLLLILPLLPPRDKLRLRATCRRLCAAVNDPAAWPPTMSFHYYRPGDKKVLDTILGLCSGRGLTKLEIDVRGKIARFPVAYFKKRIIVFSQNLCYLSLLGFDPSSAPMNALLTEHNFPSLTHLTLDACQCKYLICFPKIRSLISFEARADMISLSTVRTALDSWHENRFLPREFRLSSKFYIDVNVHTMRNVFPFIFNPLPPDQHARFQLMQCKSPLNLAPSRPYLEVNITGSTYSLPVTQCGGILTESPLVLALSPPLSATLIPNVPHFPLVETPFLSVASTLVHLCLNKCIAVGSESLEEIATHCPLLKSLSLESCSGALDTLTGLVRVSEMCLRLEGLNVKEIHGVNDPKLFWQTLSSFSKLSYLSIEYCVLPVDSQLTEEERGKIYTLLSLQIGSFPCSMNCTKCRSVSDRYLQTIGRLVPNGLRLLRMSLPSAAIGRGFKDLFGSVPNLQCLYLEKACPGNLNLPMDSVYYQNIEKFHLQCWSYEVTCDFVESLAHRKVLTHFYVKVKSISLDAVSKLIQLPRLASCHIFRKTRPYNKAKIYKAFKAQGISDFSYNSFERDLSAFDEDFKPLFSTHYNIL